jgi:hypothetical protein
MDKIKKLYIITPITLKYTEPLTETEYKKEIKAVIKEIKEGARDWAYSVVLKEGKIRVVEKI